MHPARPPEAPDYVFQVSELSWEPTERWLQLPREARRSRRGEKSVEHLAHLRRSDPLINAFAWRDLGEELRRVEDSQAARTNQQATATALRLLVIDEEFIDSGRIKEMTTGRTGHGGVHAVKVQAYGDWSRSGTRKGVMVARESEVH